MTEPLTDSEDKHIEEMTAEEMRRRLYLYHDFMAENGLSISKFKTWLKLRSFEIEQGDLNDNY